MHQQRQTATVAHPKDDRESSRCVGTGHREPSDELILPAMKHAAAFIVMLTAGSAFAAVAVDYIKDIKPLLKERCVSCHGSVKQKGDLRLDAGALIDKSVHADLISRVTSHDEDERMPPEGAQDSRIAGRDAETLVRSRCAVSER
jgi:hypothetical protein